MLMITNLILISCAAFALGLMAFCIGVWLTIWCGTHNGVEATAGKLAGYFVVVLSILTLIITSYHSARLIFNSDMMMPMMRDADNMGRRMERGMDRMEHKMKQEVNKEMNQKQ